MMWEGEYYEWAASAEAGFLSKVEREAKWKSFLDNESHARDQNGPRGYLRLLIHKGDYANDYEDVGKEQAAELSGKAKRKFDEKDVDQMVATTLSAGSKEAGSLMDFEEIRSKATFGLASSVTDADGSTTSALVGEGLLATSLRDLIKKPVAEQSDEPEDKKAKTDDAADGGDDDDTPADKKSGKGWFDPSKLAKTQREQVADLDKFLKDKQAMVTEMEEAAASFKNGPDSQKFISELRILEMRRQALDLVIQNNPSTLSEFMAKFGSREAAAAQAVVPPGRAASESSSLDMGQLYAAGPCPNYKDVRTMAEIRALCNFERCTSNDQVKETKQKKSICICICMHVLYSYVCMHVFSQSLLRIPLGRAMGYML